MSPLLSSSVINASPSSVSVPAIGGGAEGAGGRGPTGPRGPAPVSAEHSHPAGRCHAQHPPLPQHRRHTQVTELHLFKVTYSLLTN